MARAAAVTHAAAFALGVLAGLLVGLWLIARSIATPETAGAYDGFCGIHGGGGKWGGRWVEGCPGCPTERPVSVPRDPRIEELAVLAATGRTGLR